MAIRKPGSRFTDRNTIRRMHQEGYSIDQISAAVSITPEHIVYVIEKWDEDDEKNKTEVARAQAQREEEERRRQAALPHAAPAAPVVDMESIKAQVKAELLAEMQAPPETAEQEQEEPADPPKRRRRAAGD